MQCCKCSEFNWINPQSPIYADSYGNNYCLFHAPANHKGMEVDEFNERVFALIRDTDQTSVEGCVLSGTDFPGGISFSKFNESNPLPDIIFKYCIFRGEANFTRSIFSGFAFFDSAKFHEKASFFEAKFKNTCTFYDTFFNKEADFSRVIFSQYAHFDRSYIWEAEFPRCTFEHSASFRKTKFTSALFSECSIKTCTFDHIETEDSFIFNHSDISKKVLFSNTNLSRFDFRDSDMTNIHFKKCTWPEDTESNPHHRLRILPKESRIRLKLEDEPDSLEDALRFYQHMTRKYKQENNEPEASRWHFAEKSLELQILRNGPLSLPRLVLQLYDFSSQFGEGASRALVVLLLLFFLPLAILTFTKLNETGLSLAPDWSQVANVLTDWLRCIPLSRVPTQTTTVAAWKPWLFLFSQLAIGIQAARFTFALRNRFRR